MAIPVMQVTSARHAAETLVVVTRKMVDGRPSTTQL